MSNQIRPIWVDPNARSWLRPRWNALLRAWQVLMLRWQVQQHTQQQQQQPGQGPKAAKGSSRLNGQTQSGSAAPAPKPSPPPSRCSPLSSPAGAADLLLGCCASSGHHVCPPLCTAATLALLEHVNPVVLCCMLPHSSRHRHDGCHCLPTGCEARRSQPAAQSLRQAPWRRPRRGPARRMRRRPPRRRLRAQRRSSRSSRPAAARHWCRRPAGKRAPRHLRRPASLRCVCCDITRSSVLHPVWTLDVVRGPDH